MCANVFARGIRMFVLRVISYYEFNNLTITVNLIINIFLIIFADFFKYINYYFINYK